MGGELTGESKARLEESLGNNGSETITDNQEHTGDFYWITVIEDAIISAIALDEKETGNTLVGITLLAGISNPLLCSSITLSQGKVRMGRRA